MVFILCLISSYSSLSVQKKLAITECLTLILMLGILAWSRQYGWYKRGDGKGHSFPSRLVMVCVYRKTSATRCWWSFFFMYMGWRIGVFVVVGVFEWCFYRSPLMLLGRSCRNPTSPSHLSRQLFAVSVRLCKPFECGPPSCNNSRKAASKLRAFRTIPRCLVDICYFTHLQWQGYMEQMTIYSFAMQMYMYKIKVV